MAVFTLRINGKTVTADTHPEMPLLWVLRDELKLTGTKYGCGVGQCGACTIHLDGKATRSCMLPVSAVQNQQVTTIEGLSEAGDHPLQLAWQQHDVPQCGYCQAGQIMTAASFLTENPQPSEAEIKRAMNGNLCRCGTYLRICKAVKTASEKSQQEKSWIEDIF